MNSAPRQPDTTATESPSLLHRLSKTPLRDLLRGRLTARLDINNLLTQSNLPHEITNLIQRVTRRTRLWRIEKVDVTKELIAHFRDALAAGALPSSLLTNFGNEKQAANLIRRAKRRNRPLIWHAWRRAWQAVGVFLATTLISYAALAARYWSGTPTVAHDYLADINARALSVPPQQRAWPIYERLAATLEDAPKSFADYRGLYPGEPGWNDYASYLAAHTAAIDEIRAAAQLPTLGFVYPTRDDGQATSLIRTVDKSTDRQGAMRRINSLLYADLRLALANREGARSVADVNALMRLAEQSRQLGFLFGDLLAVSQVAQASETILDALAADPADPAAPAADALIDIARALAGVHGGGSLPIGFRGERLFWADFIQRSFTDDGAGDGRVTPHLYSLALSAVEPEPGAVRSPENLSYERIMTVGGPAFAMAADSRREYARRIEDMFTQFDEMRTKTLYQRTGDTFVTIDRLMRPRISSFTPIMLVSILLPSIDLCCANAELATQTRDAALVAIALEQFRRAQGAYPASLDELVPAFLPALPIDRYDGNPIKYRLTDDNKPLLYSVGNDRTDNGGRLYVSKDGIASNSLVSVWRPLLDERGNPHPRIWHDYDWILYPPVRDPIPTPAP